MNVMTKILVAESNDSTLARTLTDAGMNVGRTEMTHLATLHQAQAGPPDVLVVDVRGGRAIPSDVLALQRRHPRLGVIAVQNSLEPAFLLEAIARA